MSEVGMIIGTPGQRGHHDMEMKVVMQRTGSSLSLSLSALSGDSSDYHDSAAASSMLINADPPLGSTSPDSVSLTQARDSAMLRYKEKKKTRK
jgi:hypothetical protein